MTDCTTTANKKLIRCFRFNSNAFSYSSPEKMSALLEILVKDLKLFEVGGKRKLMSKRNNSLNLGLFIVLFMTTYYFGTALVWCINQSVKIVD